MEESPTQNPGKPLSRTQETQLRAIIDDAMSKRPVVHLTIQVMPNTDPETVIDTVRRLLSNFYEPPIGGKP